MEKERKIETILWVLFLVLLFFFALLFTGIDSNKKSISSTSNVINSYNTNNYYYYNYYSYDNSYSDCTENREDNCFKQDNYLYLRDNEEKDCQDRERDEINYFYNDADYSEPPVSPFCKNCLEVPIPSYSDPYAYDSIGNHKKEYAFGSYADTFRVWVTNSGQSGYFRVEYTFYDCDDKKTSDQERYYISYGEEKEFYVRDISHDKDAYCSWEYNVIREHD
jgi:hypothetical protein